MEMEKNIMNFEILNMKVNIHMEKEVVEEKNITIVEYLNMKENI